MATRMTENGISTCRKAGSEQFEKFQTGFGRRKRTLVQYDYRASDGELFGRFIAFPSCRKSFIFDILLGQLVGILQYISR